MNTDLIQEKQQLRQEMKRLRAALPSHQKQDMDRRFHQAFLRLSRITEAKLVYAYVSCGTEPDTRSLISSLLEIGISVAVPRVCGRQMEFYRITGFKELVPGYQGILEPDGHCEKAEAPLAPVLTPGLAFTSDGQRMGYGGGFYDRFFAREPEHMRIAFAYPFQIVKSLPAEAFDQIVHQIIMPDRVIETGGEIYGAGADWEAGKAGRGIFK